MKRLFATLLLCSIVPALPAGDKLFRHIPSGVEYLIGVDAAMLQKQSFFQELKQNPTFSNFLGNGFERSYGVKLQECERLIFAGGGKTLRATLAATTLTEAGLKARLQELGDRFTLESEGGRALYCLVSDDSIPSTRITLSLAYLEKDVVLVSEREYIKPYYAAVSAPEAARRGTVKLPGGKPLAWSYINFDSLFAGKKKKNQLALFFNGVQNAYLELNLSGKSWSITGEAPCKDNGSAVQFAILFPGFLQLGSSWIFGQDPALGQELLKHLTVYPEGKIVKLKLEVPEALGAKLADYLKQQGQQILIPPDPVPAPLQN